MSRREETYAQQRAKYKFYVVDVNKVCIASGWEYREDALEEAVAAQAEGRGPVKLMTKPAVGGQKLDPADPASWRPRRNGGPQENPHVVIKGDIGERGAGSREWEPESVRVFARRTRADAYAESGQGGPFGVVRERAIENPELDSAKAERIYNMWHKKDPTGVRVVRPRLDEDDEMVCVGQACDIVYRSGKWEKGRKTNDYVHRFDSKPRVYMLLSCAPDVPRENPGKTVGSLLAGARNADGQFAVAELATPLSFSLHNGKIEGDEVAIHAGSKVYGGTDKRTIIIHDPVWRLIIVKGGQMHFDERGIVK